MPSVGVNFTRNCFSSATTIAVTSLVSIVVETRKERPAAGGAGAAGAAGVGGGAAVGAGPAPGDDGAGGPVPTPACVAGSPGAGSLPPAGTVAGAATGVGDGCFPSGALISAPGGGFVTSLPKHCSSSQQDHSIEAATVSGSFASAASVNGTFTSILSK